MKTTKPVSMFVAVGLLGGAAAVPATSLLFEDEAFAQSSTSGAVRGVIRDSATNDVVIGATVVITGPALQGQQAEITDENGSYVIQNLPPGTYVLTVFYNDAQFDRPNVLIQVGKQVVVNVTINTAEATGGETIVVEGRAPIVDQGSTKTGATITKDFTDNVPVGRTFGAVLGAAAGSQGDFYGISMSGSTSVENTYIVEGINTTDTAYGLLSSNLPNEFVQETEVITGGYNAEFGRSTGGVISVVTKQGSNEFHGSVFGYFTPGALVAEATRIDRAGSAIDSTNNLDYRWDVGAEIGGPIVKDKIWFHVGFNPSYVRSITDRTISTQVDRVTQNARFDTIANMPDGVPDRDPNTGFTVKEVIPGTLTEIPLTSETYFFTSKINAAISEDHQFQLSAWGNPRNGVDPYQTTTAPTRFRYEVDDGAYDAALKWTSKLADGKTQVDVVAGYHRGYEVQRPLDADGHKARMFYRFNRNLAFFDGVNGEAVPDECMDHPTLNNPAFGSAAVPCPVLDYSTGGLGFVEDRTNERIGATLAVTQRVKLAGYHTFKLGLEAEYTTYDGRNQYTSGHLYEQFSNRRWRDRYHLEVVDFDQMQPGGVDCLPGIDHDGDGAQDFYCNIFEPTTPTSLDAGYRADTLNRNLGAYLQDSWQLRPNFTLNAGLRLEQQTGYTAAAIQGGPTPEGDTVPDIGYQLNMFAPRIGVIYDPTQEGRAKIFGHYGRFYEQVPMDINVRAFGGEVLYLARTSPGNTSCDEPDVATSAVDPAMLADCNFSPQILLGLGSEYVTPGLKGQYISEIILGTEYELMPDFKVGLNYIHRDLPVAIEDISIDGGETYIITNPGEDFSSQAADLRAQAMRETDPDRAALLEQRATYLDAVDDFDKPIRNYDAIQFTANQRFSRTAMLLASYTYSRSVGNFPGLFSTETFQLDPNLTSMYDLQDLMANRYGALGHDRPHNFKIDGFKIFDLKAAGFVTLGTSFRAQSGIPQNTLGAHVFYGGGESYLLPRGSIDRSPMHWQVDVKGIYGRRIGKTSKLEGFVDVFNLFNNQEEVRVDQVYTTSFVNPIVGGDASDLRHAKSQFDARPDLTPTRNLNFGNTSQRQAPLSVRFGVRVTF
jgi:hypothetical protein